MSEQQDGYIEITVITGLSQPVERFYGPGEELAAEAFREGVIAVAAHTDLSVSMQVMYHPHSDEWDECQCAQFATASYTWRNRAASL